MRVKTKKLVDAERETERIVHDIAVGGLGAPSALVSSPVVANIVEEVPVERETFDVAYECRHCHHKWTETVTVVERA